MNDFPNIEILPVFDEVLFENVEHNITAEGNFEKNILILLTQPNEAENTLLQNMLKACKLTSNDCKFLYVTATTPLVKCIQALKPKIILSFGIEMKTENFAINYKLNTPFNFAGITCIITHDLNTLNQNKNAKAELWTNALQKVFL